MEMKLLSSKINRINANRNSEFSGKLKLDSNVKINNIEDYGKESGVGAIKVDGVFEVDYNELGKVEIEGSIYLGLEKENIKEIIENYKNKKYNSSEQIQIINIVMQKFSIKAFEIEEELGLPIHIRLPSLEIKKED